MAGHWRAMNKYISVHKLDKLNKCGAKTCDAAPPSNQRFAACTFAAGYQGAGSQQLDATGALVGHGDTKEAFLMTNNALLQDPAHEPVPGEPFAGATLRLPPVPGHAEVATAYTSACCALNARLNELLFDALELPEAKRSTLGSRPFVASRTARPRLWDLLGPRACFGRPPLHVAQQTSVLRSRPRSLGFRV